MATTNTINAQLKTLSGLMVKGFARVEGQIEGFEKKLGDRIDSVEKKLGDKIDGVEKKLVSEIDDLAGMTAREFKAVRSEIATQNIQSNLRS